MMITRLAAALLLALLSASVAHAQSALSTDNRSQTITLGGTYQAVDVANNVRRMLQIQNNNTNTDNCWINDDGTVAVGNTTATTVTVHGQTMASSKASILLTPGSSYTRYYPYVPDGPIVATCATTSDSLYVGVH